MRLKQFISKLTGYWLYKKKYLPIGIDMFVDIEQFFSFRKFNVVFDVGANKGQSVVLFNTRLSVKKIFSFEPIPETFKELKSNIEKYENTVAENIGLGGTEGKFEVNINKYSALNSLKLNEGVDLTGETVTVDILTLDQYCQKNEIKFIDFLKIDTEGYELEVMEGAMTMLKGGKIKFVYCEVGFDRNNKRHTYWEDVNKLLVPLGYRFVAFYDMSYKVFSDHSGNALYILEL